MWIHYVHRHLSPLIPQQEEEVWRGEEMGGNSREREGWR